MCPLIEIEGGQKRRGPTLTKKKFQYFKQKQISFQATLSQVSRNFKNQTRIFSSFPIKTHNKAALLFVQVFCTSLNSNTYETKY